MHACGFVLARASPLCGLAQRLPSRLLAAHRQAATKAGAAAGTEVRRRTSDDGVHERRRSSHAPRPGRVVSRDAGHKPGRDQARGRGANPGPSSFFADASFEGLGAPQDLITALKAEDIHRPSHIQVTCARSGSRMERGEGRCAGVLPCRAGLPVAAMLPPTPLSFSASVVLRDTCWRRPFGAQLCS